MEKIKKHLNLKCYTSVGFYFSATAALLALIAAIVYGAGFQKETLSQYYSAAPVALLVVGFIVYLVLVAFKESSVFAPKVLWAFTFAGFLSFIGTAYMYLSGVFYNGVSLSAMSLIDSVFMGSAVLMLIACILGNAAIWMKQTGKEEEAAKDATAEKAEEENETNI